MEADFERAERRRDKERKEAERTRKIRAEEDARIRKVMEEAERKRLAALEVQRDKEARRREREEEEALSAGGIRFAAFLRPVPLANLETDRVRLPPSTLQKLLDEGAIEGNVGNVLTFELALFDDKSETIISKTHCGVLEFTAEEGTVEVPIKAVMSLCKDKGESTLLDWRLRVRYVALERFPKIYAKVQPLGKGFHVDGSDTANIDLKTVLERVLSNQTTISQGDWIPVRHEGRTYTLAVRELSPEPQAVLLNTDVEIDLMPSEEVMIEKQRQEQLEREGQLRKQKAQELAAWLPVEPMTGGITIRARFPESVVGTRKFEPDAKLELVFKWAESLLGNIAPPTQTAQLEIVQSILPGQFTIIDQSQYGRTLREVGFGRSENLNFRWKAEPKGGIVAESTAEQTSRPSSSASAEEWTMSRLSAESHLDRDLVQQAEHQQQINGPMEDVEGEASLQSEELSNVDMFRLLVAKGAEPQSAARACQKFLNTLRTLKSLGLLETPRSGLYAVELCEKFKGSSGRIADAMIAKLGNEDEDQGRPNQDTAYADRWGGELEMLESMFQGRDRQELMRALEKHGGSVQKAVNELLS